MESLIDAYLTLSNLNEPRAVLPSTPLPSTPCLLRVSTSCLLSVSTPCLLSVSTPCLLPVVCLLLFAFFPRSSFLCPLPRALLCSLSEAHASRSQGTARSEPRQTPTHIKQTVCSLTFLRVIPSTYAAKSDPFCAFCWVRDWSLSPAFWIREAWRGCSMCVIYL